ncbi:MAG: hypothetical protein Kow0098_03240 [Ignavibacteriaceae bacterium]
MPVGSGKGRAGYVYQLESLPEEARRKYYECDKTTAVEKTDPELRDKEEKVALARVDVVREYLNYVNAGDGTKLQRQQSFVRAFNNGAFLMLQEKIGKISRGTVERWKKTWLDSNKDYRALAPKYKIKKSTSVTTEQADILIKLALHPNKTLISEVVRNAMEIIEVKGIGKLLSEATYRRFLERWKAKNYDLWTFYREGNKALNDKVLPYIERNYESIEVGDILVGDGHVLNFDIINPFTGKPKRMMMPLFIDMKSAMPLGWEISPTENVQSIAMALYRSLLRLGKIPKIVYLDNGKAFKAKYFQAIDFKQCGLTGLFERLGIEVITAWPYHGQSKTIERFFKTFGELERLMPTYTGTSIELQPPRMNRGEQLHRKLHERLTDGTSFDLLTAHRAVAWWFDRYALRPQNGSLKGKAPIEIFEAGRGPGLDKNELRYLLMKQNEPAQIYRNGIRFLSDYYWNDALYGRKEKVMFRYDLTDQSAIYVYDLNGEFICTAYKREKIHPAAGVLGTTEDVKKLEEAIQHKRTLIKSTTTDARDFLTNEIYPAAKEQLINANIIQLQNNQVAEREEVEKQVKKTGTDNINFEELQPLRKKKEEARDWF